MKQELLTIRQTFVSPTTTARQPTIQQKVEHYLQSLLRTTPKPT